MSDGMLPAAEHTANSIDPGLVALEKVAVTDLDCSLPTAL
jgi:hypothetical protein